MKIQTKKGLLHTFRENPLRANMEKDILASCQHPFIGRLEYSFQTESLAIMVGFTSSTFQQSKFNRIYIYIPSYL